MRGAWIEIPKLEILDRDTNRRAPCGARGLKYFRTPIIGANRGVAPHAGRVD